MNKSALTSKTVWTQILALLAALFPMVNQWISENPVEFVAAFGAVNTAVRFVTSGRISLVMSSAKSNLIPALFLPAFFCALCFSQVSCTHLQIPENFKTSLNFIHPGTGASGGVECDETGCRPSASVPFVDTDGNVVGEWELTTGK